MKRRLLVALGLLCGVVLMVASRTGAGMVGGSRLSVVGLLGLGAVLVLWNRRGASRRDDWEAPSLEVRARTGLTPRCGVALIEAEGQSFLVVHGEGFATVHGMPPQLPAVRPVSRELMQ